MRGLRLALGMIVVVALVALTGLETLGKKGGKKPPPADPAIAYRSYNRVKVMNADGSNQATVHEASTSAAIYSVSWSGDGGHISFVEEDSYLPEPNSILCRIDVEVVDGVPVGSGRTVLVSDVEVWTARWSPDSDRIAFIAQRSPTDAETRDVRMIAATGGTPQILYTPPIGRWIGSITWSPESNRIAFTECDDSIRVTWICVLDLLTNSTTKIEVPRSENHVFVEGIAWAKTQDVFAYCEVVQKTSYKGKKAVGTYWARTIHFLDLATGETSEVTGGRTPSWSPDDSQLVWSGITKFDIATSEKSDLGDGNGPDWRR
jgi:Tol biopolymer transport system component